MPSRSRAAPLARLARWGALTATVLMATALLATVWSSHVGVRNASHVLERGQGELLERELRHHARQWEQPVTALMLETVLTELGPSGLRYIASIDRGEGITAEAGTPVGELDFEPGRERGARGSRGRGSRARPEPVGDRIRSYHRIWAPRDGDRASRDGALASRDGGRTRREGGRARRSQLLVVEYEPMVARDLRARSMRTLAIGGVAAGAFLLVAIGLGRWLLRRERIERDRERHRRLASLGEMSAVLAHEIRNPLASLKGNAQLLAQMIPEGERTHRKAARVVGEAIRLEALTSDLLEFVRTGAIHPAPTDPAELLRTCAASVEPPADSPMEPPIKPPIGPALDRAIELDLSVALPSISLDAARVRQAITNLLQNAVEAGGPVRLSARPERGGLAITVRDRGPGIAAGDEDRIFEPFFTKQSRGTGLGLAVARRVVRLHGGHIAVSNVDGGGAEFRIWFPGTRARGRK